MTRELFEILDQEQQEFYLERDRQMLLRMRLTMNKWERQGRINFINTRGKILERSAPTAYERAKNIHSLHGRKYGTLEGFLVAVHREKFKL